jgi:uncharacterized membrane protein
MNWLFTTITAVVCFSLVNGITKFYNGKIHPLYALVPQVIASLIVSITIAFGFKIFSPKGAVLTTQGISIAVIAGVIWAIGQLMFCVTISKNPPYSVVIPIMVGGAGIGGIIAGVGFFSEQLTIARIIGIVLVLIGSIVLARS